VLSHSLPSAGLAGPLHLQVQEPPLLERALHAWLSANRFAVDRDYFRGHRAAESGVMEENAYQLLGLEEQGPAATEAEIKKVGGTIY